MRKKFPTFPTSKIRNRTAKSVLVLAAAVYLIFLAVRDDKAHKEYQQVFSQAQEYFAAYFIDVGQGDATLLVAPDGSSMLIDCGPTAGAEYLVKYMNDVGVEKLDYLILTHPHEDHYGGASAVIENFPVENFVVHADFTETYPYDRLIYMVSHNRLMNKPKSSARGSTTGLPLRIRRYFRFFRRKQSITTMPTNRVLLSNSSMAKPRFCLRETQKRGRKKP